MKTPELIEALNTLEPILKRFVDHPTIEVCSYSICDFGMTIAGSVDFEADPVDFVKRSYNFQVTYNGHIYQSDVRFFEDEFALHYWEILEYGSREEELEGLLERLTLDEVFNILTSADEMERRSS